MRRGAWLGMVAGGLLTVSAASAWAQSVAPTADSHPGYVREPLEGAVRAGVAVAGEGVDPGWSIGLGGYARLIDGLAFGPVLQFARFYATSLPSGDGSGTRTGTIDHRYLGLAVRIYALDETRFDPYLELLPIGFQSVSSELGQQCGGGLMALGIGAGLNGFVTTWLRLGLGARVVVGLGGRCEGTVASGAYGPSVGGAGTVAVEAMFATRK